MLKACVVGRSQLDENPRKQLGTPEDYASIAKGALRNGSNFYRATLAHGIHNPQ